MKLPFLPCAALFLLSALQRAESATPDCPVSGCSSLVTCDTLDEVVAYLMCKSPGEGSQRYIPPPPNLLGNWKQVVGGMLMGAECSTPALPDSLQQINYELERFSEESGDYCVLASFDVDESGNYLARPHGAVVVNLASDDVVKPLSIDIPHGNHDDQTYRQGISIFKGTNAKSFTLSVAHRKTTTQPSCQGNRYFIADPAHNRQHTFQMSALAIKEHYDNLHKDFTAIQFHGMGTSTCPNDDMFMTNGYNCVPKAGEKLELLRDAFRNQLSDPKEIERVNMIGDSNCTLVGSKNTQGRLYNGVSPDAVCDTPATGYTGQFVHIEQKHFIRISQDYDQTWINALNTVNFEEVTKPVHLPLALRFTSFNSGDTMVRSGGRVEITWECSGLAEEDVVELSVHRALDQGWIHGIEETAPNTGYYSWDVPSGLPADEDLILRIKHDLLILDFSKAHLRVMNHGSVLTDLR